MPAEIPSVGPLTWWARVLRFAVLGQPPRADDEVPAWCLSVPARIWDLPKKPHGRSFADSYGAGWPRPLRRWLPLRLLYLAFLGMWPLVALGRALTGAWSWRGAMARPDLAMLHPQAAPSPRELGWSRPDYLVGMFYAWEYACFRADHHALDDKRVFAERCREAGLPAPRTVTGEEAVDAGGRWIVKQPQADQGAGVWLVDASELDGDPEVVELLVQEHLRNDPRLFRLLPRDAPLSTLRVLTLLEEGGPVVQRLAFRAGRAGRLTDNASGGGLWAPVDPETGRVGDALEKRNFLKRDRGVPIRVAAHPDTGVPFSELEIPGLGEAVALAIRAHATLAPDAVALGWDVALTERGPLLLEVNFWAASYDDTPRSDALAPTLRAIRAAVTHRQGR